MWFALPAFHLLKAIIRMPFKSSLQELRSSSLSSTMQESVTRQSPPLMAKVLALLGGAATSFRTVYSSRWTEMGLPPVSLPKTGLLSPEGLAGMMDRMRDMGMAWTELARGDGPQEKAFATALGYVVTAISLGFILESSGPNVGTAGRLARSVLRQQVIVLKVSLYIVFVFCCVDFRSERSLYSSSSNWCCSR